MTALVNKWWCLIITMFISLNIGGGVEFVLVLRVNYRLVPKQSI